MTQEQKAKAYDELLAKAKQIYNKENDVLIIHTIEDLFPQFKESEDERIRKQLLVLIEWSKSYAASGITTDDAKDMIAWLEKQCKQKINLVEILKHYPKETELYSPLYGKLWLAEVDEENEIITCYKHPLNKGCTRAILEQEDTVSFYSDGTIGLLDFSVSKDCMLFLYDIEKQGEKPQVYKTEDGEVITYSESEGYNVVEPKFKVGDWITFYGGEPFKILKIEAEVNGILNYLLLNQNGHDSFYNKEYVDENARLWTLKDAKKGDILFKDLMDGKTFIFDGINPEMAILYSFIINNDGKDVLPYDIGKPNTGIGYVEDGNIIYPATKEQRDLLFSKIKEKGYKWDAEKKELKKV